MKICNSKKNLFSMLLALVFNFNITSYAVLAQNIPLRTIDAKKSTSSKELIPLIDNNAIQKNQGSATIQLKGGVKIDTKEQLISLTLAKSDIKQVLRMLADKSSRNIIIDESVDGEISLDLVNVTVNKVFEYIMTLKNLTYWQDGNTIIVATSDKASELGLNITEIKPIKIKYVDAQKIADFLNSNIFTKTLNKPDISQKGIVTSNPASNEIFVFGTKNDYEMAKKIVAQFDKEIQVNTFNVNYTDTGIMASKICMTVFQSTTAAAPASGSSGVSSVCSGTASTGGSGSGNLTAFTAPSYNVMADADLSQITIYGGTQEQINMTRQIIKSFDKKEPQVYMEISIIELSEDGTKDFKNAFNINTKIDQPIDFKNDTEGIGTSELSYPFNFKKLTLNVPDNFSGKISYLISTGKARLLSNPRIIASNNTESSINITEEYVVGITTQFDDQGNPTSRSPKTDSTGITLSIKPKISPNGYVTLDLSPTYSASKGSVTVGTEEVGLKKQRTFESKNVRVKDGDTLVIAGLIQETENNSQSRFPYLSTIPVLGVMFKNMNTSKSRSELIFMITPKIIKDDDVETI